MKSNASLAYSCFLVVGDFFALVAAFTGAYILRVSIDHRRIAYSIHASTYLELFLFLLPFWILTFGVLGLYNSSIHEKRFTEAARLFIGSFVGLLFVVSYGYATNRIIFPARLVPVYGFILAFVFLLIFRNLTRFTRSELFRYDIGVTNLLIVGNTRIADELAVGLANWKISGYRIVGIVSGKEETKKRFTDFKVFPTFEKAVAKLHANDIHSIVQTELYSSNQENNYILEFAQMHHISYRFIPGNAELFVGNIAVELFRSSIPVIAVHQTALIGWGRIVKRLFDLIFGTISLVIALPFILIIALLVLLFGGRGGIFFRQTRLTRFNQGFKVFKFRTTKDGFTGLTPRVAFEKIGQPELLKTFYDNGEFLPNDPRYTKIGLFLRKTSLDELPQLFNVLKGDISLVGPRALIPQEINLAEKRHAILSVKSGVTGLAQISGRKNLPFDERRKLDLYYVQNWSLWMDVMIIIKTFRAVLHGNGAR